MRLLAFLITFWIWLVMILLFYYYRNDRYIRAREVSLTIEFSMLYGIVCSISAMIVFSDDPPSCELVYLGSLGITCVAIFTYILLLWKIIRRYIANTADFEEKYAIISKSLSVRFAYHLLFKKETFRKAVRYIQCIYSVVLIVSVCINFWIGNERRVEDNRSCVTTGFFYILLFSNMLLFVFIGIVSFGFMQILRCISKGSDHLDIGLTFRRNVWWVFIISLYFDISFVLVVILEQWQYNMLFAVGLGTFPFGIELMVIPLLKKGKFHIFNNEAIKGANQCSKNSKVALFERYIHSEDGFKLYSCFLREELSVESLLFVWKVTAFRKSLTRESLSSSFASFRINVEHSIVEESDSVESVAANIVEEFLLPDSPSLINASWKELDAVRQEFLTEKHLKPTRVFPEPDSEKSLSMFSALYQEQIELMIDDSFPRFFQAPQNLKAFTLFSEVNNDLDLAGVN